MAVCRWKLLLFDLDGLLVNTEMMHYRAYQKACKESGGVMNWDFDTYFQVASRSSTGVRERLYRENPRMFLETSWDELYGRKQEALLALVRKEPIPLMPGVVEFLEKARDERCRMACVTHSKAFFVEKICAQHPILTSIHSWFPRESYERPKPYPDGYLKAVEQEGVSPDQAIGFEDSLRGVQSQIDAGIHSVLVTKDEKTREAACTMPSVFIVESLHEARHRLFEDSSLV